jgi:hypothetical protein
LIQFLAIVLRYAIRAESIQFAAADPLEKLTALAQERGFTRFSASA